MLCVIHVSFFINLGQLEFIANCEGLSTSRFNETWIQCATYYMECLRMYPSENSNPKTLANFEIFYSSVMNAPLHKKTKFKIVTINQSKSQLITTDGTIT